MEWPLQNQFAHVMQKIMFDGPRIVPLRCESAAIVLSVTSRPLRINRLSLIDDLSSGAGGDKR